MTHTVTCWVQRHWWRALAVLLLWWGAVALLQWREALHVQRGFALQQQQVAALQQVVAMTVRATEPALWRTLPWERWAQQAGMQHLHVARVTGEPVAGGAAFMDAPSCTAGSVRAALHCVIPQTIADARGDPLVQVRWVLPSLAWRQWYAPGVRWFGLLLGTLLAALAGALLWWPARSGGAEAATTGDESGVPQSNRHLWPQTAHWAAAVAELLTQPVIVLDPQYGLLGANAAAQQYCPRLRDRMEQHLFDAIDELPEHNRLLATLDRLGAGKPLCHYLPAQGERPGIGIVRLIGAEQSLGYWILYDTNPPSQADAARRA